jgi:YHS domain-containing protein
MFKITCLMTFFFLSSLAAEAQTTSERQKHFLLDKQHLALEGYDPVSYFSGKPAKGKKDYSQTQNGVTYYFVSAANREVFKANPAKYEPAYGGWCAYAMAKSGEKVEVDPKTFKIVNGRLLLFYNAFFTNTLESWNGQKEPENERLKMADKAWERILKN